MSDGRDCAATVTAQDLLKMVAVDVEPPVLVFHTIEKCRTLHGGLHRRFVKRGFAARVSAGWKHFGFQLSEAPAGAMNDVHIQEGGKLRQHRCDTRRKTVAEPIGEVFGRSPLWQRWDRSRSRDEKPTSRLQLRRQSLFSKIKVVEDQVCDCEPRLTLQYSASDGHNWRSLAPDLVR